MADNNYSDTFRKLENTRLWDTETDSKYMRGQMVWFESAQKWVCASNIKPGDYTGQAEWE